jgi:uncharacterized membrane protein
VSLLKRYLIAGLLVWLPLAVTIWVLQAVLGVLDGVFFWLLDGSRPFLPSAFDPALGALSRMRGLGVLVMFAALLLTGLFATNIVGQWSLKQGHRLLNNIPIVKSIYSSVKQVSDTLFSSSGNAFRQAVLVEYPRQGSWTIAFVTGRPAGETAHHLPGDYLSVYVPTTPNPTSGFFLMVPRLEVITLAMSVDEALKYVISMGVVAPPMHLRPAGVRAEVSSTAARDPGESASALTATARQPSEPVRHPGETARHPSG